jgi:hypothetical protein
MQDGVNIGNENSYPIETQCQNPDLEEIQVLSDRARTSCYINCNLLLFPVLPSYTDPLRIPNVVFPYGGWHAICALSIKPEEY